MKKLFYLLLLFSQQLLAQIPLSGIVASGDKQPLEGATVHVKGDSATTATDKSGKFTITTSSNAVLIISHVGYQTAEVKVKGNSTLYIALEKAALTLEEVTLSTGYQSVSKASVIGSYNKIDNDLYNYKTGSDVLGRLDGITSSVLFDRRKNASPDIKIRGISTLGFASTAPLIVVDNFPYEGDINNINPNDVESVTILKDAAASAIWGIRAANGVIVITTKKGQFSQPLRFSFSSNITYVSKPGLFAIPKMSTSDFIDVEKFLFDKGFYNSDISNTSTRPPLTPVVEILARQRAGLLSAADATLQIDAFRNMDVRNDYEKFLYRDAINMQYAFNLSGGNRNNKYYFSTGYDHNMDNLSANSNERFTVRLDNTYMPLQNVRLLAGVGYTQSNITANSPGGYGDLFIIGGKEIYPYASLATADGRTLPINNLYRGTYTDTAGQGKLLDWKYRPLDELNAVDREIMSRAIIANFGIQYDLSKSVNAEVKYQLQETLGSNENNYSVNSFIARNLINKFTQINSVTVKYIVPYGGILDASDSRLSGYAVRGQLNINKKWNKNSFTAIAGAEARQTELWSSSRRVYGYDDKLNFTSVDYVNTYPTYGNIAGTANIENNAGFSDILDRAVSLYANGTFTLHNIYSISGSIRKDASNLFGVKANMKGVPLWSAGSAWKISKGKFYHLHFLPELNFRVSYGYGGNVSSSISARTTILYSPASDQPVTNIPFAIVQNNPNPNLTWEKAGIFNAGIDFAFPGERITGSIDYFRKNINNLLGSESLDPTVGFTSLVTNSAVMNGHGLDVVIHSKNISARGFKWETDFFSSYVRNRVVKYLSNSQNKGYVSDGSNISPITGFEPYSVVSYKWGGLDSTGNPVGFVGGVKSTNYTAILANPLSESVVNGPALPPYFGAMRNTFSYKRFSVSVNITWKFGFYFRRDVLNYSSLFFNSKGNPEYQDRWQKPGDENITNVPVMIYPRNANREIFYQYADINVEKGDNVRLEDIRIGWETGKDQKKLLRNFRFYAMMSNLNVLLWKINRRGIDPIYPSGNITSARTTIGFKTDF